MTDEYVISNFQNIRLTKNQHKLLKKAYKSRKPPKQEPTKANACFKPEILLENIESLIFIGVVPDDVLLLHFLGFVDPLNPELDPTKDDDIAKNYIITDIGKMYYIYYRERRLLNYLPITLSIFSILFTIFINLDKIIILFIELIELTLLQ